LSQKGCTNIIAHKTMCGGVIQLQMLKIFGEFLYKSWHLFNYHDNFGKKFVVIIWYSRKVLILLVLKLIFYLP